MAIIRSEYSDLEVDAGFSRCWVRISGAPGRTCAVSRLGRIFGFDQSKHCVSSILYGMVAQGIGFWVDWPGLMGSLRANSWYQRCHSRKSCCVLLSIVSTL